MISSKIKKGKISDLLVQFSRNAQSWPSVIQNFYQACKDEGAKVSKVSILRPETIRFYIIDDADFASLVESKEIYEVIEGRALKSKTSEIELKLTVVYLNDQQDQILKFSRFNTSSNESSRVLLLRQTLSPFYDLKYQIESTLSPQESISYLCELSASLIDSKYQGQVEQFQQKKQLMIRKGNEGNLSLAQAAWKNMMFQVPGIGKDKAKQITQNFTCYQEVLADCDNKKSLKNLMVNRGTKGAKIGKATADRIYKVFGSQKQNQKLY